MLLRSKLLPMVDEISLMVVVVDSCLVGGRVYEGEDDGEEGEE